MLVSSCDEFPGVQYWGGNRNNLHRKPLCPVIVLPASGLKPQEGIERKDGMDGEDGGGWDGGLGCVFEGDGWKEERNRLLWTKNNNSKGEKVQWRLLTHDVT